MELKEGEPIHQMVARAILHGAFKWSGGTFETARYSFVGPHGIAYEGRLGWMGSGPAEVAAKCEEIQHDFNARMAGSRMAMEEAERQKQTAPTFKSLL